MMSYQSISCYLLDLYSESLFRCLQTYIKLASIILSKFKNFLLVSSIFFGFVKYTLP